MTVRVKICGLTTPAGIASAVAAGADALGFVFAESPRRIDPQRARELCRELPPFVARVAVFHQPSPAEVERVCQLFAPDLVQAEPETLAGVQLPAGTRLLPVFHDDGELPRAVEDYLARRHRAAGPALLLEGAGRGGRGVQADWDRVAGFAARVPVVLAGGLSAANVGEAIRRVRPYAVDVSSGVESSPGQKDPAAIRAFVAAVRAAEGAL